MAGRRRKGRRVDSEASLATLRVLNAYDQEQQAALSNGALNMIRGTKREMNALDVRVAILMRGELTREITNPISPTYIHDTLGLTSRDLFSAPHT